MALILYTITTKGELYLPKAIRAGSGRAPRDYHIRGSLGRLAFQGIAVLTYLSRYQKGTFRELTQYAIESGLGSIDRRTLNSLVRFGFVVASSKDRSEWEDFGDPV